MKQIIFLFTIISLACCQNITQPKKEIPLIKKDSIIGNDIVTDIEEGRCIYRKYDKKSNVTYPFNKADKIEIVYYPFREDSYTNNELIKDNQFTVKNIKERIILNANQKEELFSILYDYTTKSEKFYVDSTPADCYNPRHSIIFYSGDKVISYLEVCLECGGYKANSGFGNFCSDKYCMLQHYFKSSGIKNGIIDEMCGDSAQIQVDKK